MTARRVEPIRKEEFTKDQWFDICRRETPKLTREEFDRQWPQFCKFIEEMQNMEIIEFTRGPLNG